ncbi:hypothetical protein KDA11_04535, partial [Candidatus Saccharibacteria bacterium]|nr:hypothetical protein [Candidatus Saccharibacteria bacterium]
MQKNNHLLKKLFLSSLTVLGFFVCFNILSPPKASALGCYPGTNAAYYNAQVQVMVLNPDGTFRKWSNDYSFRVVSADPKPYGNSYGVPENGIYYNGKPGFPTNDAVFNAKAGDGMTQSCLGLNGQYATSVVFGDSTDGHPFLGCHWGTWGAGPGREHGLSFFFNPLSVNDAGGSGYWVPGASGYIEQGGTRDANNQQAVITFQYRLTSVINEPTGYLDTANCNVISGWSRDLDAPGGVINVHLYFDGPPGGGGVGLSLDDAGVNRLYRPDLGGNFGFSIASDSSHIPVDLTSGTHTVRAYAINVGGGSNRELTNSPLSIGPCPLAEARTTGTTSTIIDSNEDPNQVIFSGSISQTSGGYNVSVTRRYFIVRSGGDKNVNADRWYFRTDSAITLNGNQNLGPVSITDIRSAPYHLQVGDSICSSLIIDSPQVRIKSDGSVVNPASASETDPSCERLVNKPFIS